jgi:hypothetical protein
MILTNKHPLWAFSYIIDGESKPVRNCISYNSTTKEAILFVLEKTEESGALVYGRIIQDVNGRNITETKVLPGSKVIINCAAIIAEFT